MTPEERGERVERALCAYIATGDMEAVLQNAGYFRMYEVLELALRALMPTSTTKLRIEAKRTIRGLLGEGSR